MLANAANRRGSRTPAIIASMIRRPLAPMMSESTESSLTLASASVFWIRWTCRVCSRPSCLRVRSSERSSCISSSGTKLGFDQPAGQKIGNPHRIVQIGLATRNVLDVRRIGDDQGEVSFAQDLPHRHPIDPGCLHRHVAAATFLQPRQQSPQAVRRRVKRPAFPRHPAASPKPNTGNNRRLVDVKTGNPFVHNLHRIFLLKLRRQRGEPE